MRLLGSAVLVLAMLVPQPQGAEPHPQHAAPAILAAFDRYDLVGMNAAHSDEKMDAFIMSLIREPAFAGKVNDLVVECGTSGGQPLLDRYIGGEDVRLEEARQTWRQTGLRMCALSAFYEQFFPAIRALNVRLPKERRLRVLVTEPAAAAGDRNASIAAIVTAEVLEKHRKALILCGVGHLYHDEEGTAVSTIEKRYPGRTFVIDPHHGFAAFFDLDRGRALEARMQSWPDPSLVTVKGSWLADLDLPYFLWPFPRRMSGQSYADLVDGYLYLGPGASLTYERTPESILNDAEYLADVARRLGAVNVDNLRKRNDVRALFTAADIAEAHQFAPGAEYVGIYTTDAPGTPAIEIDFHNGRLAARQVGSATWIEPITLSAADPADPSGRLTLDRGPSAPKITLVRRKNPM